MLAPAGSAANTSVICETVPGCLRVPVNPLRPALDAVRLGAEQIRRGRVIAAPTDTLYGLLADARSERALRAIFRAKRRPATKPILLLVDSLARVRQVARDDSKLFATLATEFWPGPLTIVLPAKGNLPPMVTAGLDTVAVRLPSSPLVRALGRQAGCPLTGTSANLSGRAGARSADEVQAQLGDRLPLILDSGRVTRPVPSTILDLASSEPRILRQGRVRSSEIKRLLRSAASL